MRKSAAWWLSNTHTPQAGITTRAGECVAVTIISRPPGDTPTVADRPAGGQFGSARERPGRGRGILVRRPRRPPVDAGSARPYCSLRDGRNDRKPTGSTHAHPGADADGDHDAGPD